MLLKRVELWWRGLWIRLLVSLMRRPSDARPDWDSGPRRVLFLRHDRAGDMIVSTGVMRAIARSHATITLDVLASPRNADLVRHTDYLADVIVFDKRKLSGYVGTLMRLRRARYDAVIDCMVTAPSVTTLLLVLASGARYRIGIAARGNDAAFNVRVPGVTDGDAHMVDRLASLATPFGPALTAEQRQPTLSFTAVELARAASVWNTPPGTPRVLVNISAGAADRLWPDERYVAVMRHVLGRTGDAVIRIISSPDEADRAERIARKGGGIAVHTPSIRDAVALVATADFVFTPDTSIAHAASALQKPAVAIYGKGSMARWAL
ncbi:MAG TPA: glycosyltransferase family 9 protein, partial [Gemmatimonadaceae bacterium]